MRFEDAITEMKRGAKIKRPDWKTCLYLLIKDGKVFYRSKTSGQDHFFSNFAQVLIFADDWEVVE